MNAKLLGPILPNLPWEDPPVGYSDAVWRYSKNPIISRNAIPTSNSIFNSAAVPYRDGFAGVFRCDNRRREMRLHAGFSDDGFLWHLCPDPIEWRLSDGELEPPEYGYDPRVVEMDGRYWVTWCNGYHGPTIGIGWTTDFRSFTMVGNAFLPYNRNGVLFPRKFGQDYLMLTRPSDNGHTAFGEMFLSRSPDLVHWGRHQWVAKGENWWESTKIGAGPIPIETTEGWLIFHHGVLTSCNGYVYHFGAMLTEADRPWVELARTPEYLLSPQCIYEQVGDVPNVVFPCAAMSDSSSGRIAIYYGGADTVTCLAFTTLDRVLAAMEPRRTGTG